MVARTRNRVLAGPQGFLTAWNGTKAYRTAQQALNETCKDTVGQYSTINPFDLTRISRTECMANGKDANYTYSSYPAHSIGSAPGHLAFSAPSADVARILAASTPSRPVVDLPVAVFELKDLPGMIRFAGTTLFRLGKRYHPYYFLNKEFGAEANLQWQFGWAPLLSDLYKLLEFHSHVAKRRKELETMYSKGVLRRRVTLGNGSTAVSRFPSSGTTVFNSYPRVEGYTNTQTTYEAWATVKWFPEFTFVPEASTLEEQAFRSALGLDLTTSTIWESLPWSWLIDWCTNIGDFFMSHRNTVPARPGTIAVMRRTVTTTKLIRTNSPAGVTMTGDSTVTRTSLFRTSAAPTPVLNVSVPFLDPRKLSILGSLAVLNKASWRFRGYMR